MSEKRKDASDSENTGKDGNGSGNQEPGVMDWTLGAVSAAVILAIIGFLTYQALQGTSVAPILKVEAERILEAPDGYLVEFRAENTGSVTAQGLTVEGTLHERGGNGQPVETSNTTVQWVPGHSARSGGLLFTKDPRDYRLELRPLGYDRP